MARRSQSTESKLGELGGRMGSCGFEGKESCWLGQEGEGGLVWLPGKDRKALIPGCRCSVCPAEGSPTWLTRLPDE